jgi:hypothetical protein
MYVPEVALAKIYSGQIHWIAELRKVTVLFLLLPETNATSEEELAASVQTLQKIMETVQKVLKHYEGSIRQFIVDGTQLIITLVTLIDKGTVLIAAFGLPTLSHEGLT